MNSKQIIDILTTFQEGVIEGLKMEGEDLNFKIECTYLADLINPEYKYFYGTLKGVKDIFFQHWDNENNLVTSMEEIKEMKPEILNIEEEENGYIKIYTNCQNTQSGGNIYFKAEDIKVFNEDFLEMTPEELSDLSERFWFSSEAEG